MANEYDLNADDWQRLSAQFSSYTGNVEATINDYLHNDAAELLVRGITQFIPVSTGHANAHIRYRRKYKHKKTTAHAKFTEWWKEYDFNLSIKITNTKDFYYLYFVEHGLGTSSESGGVDFLELGMENVYQKVIDGIYTALNKEI
ncbi:MAG: hypothetical protein NC397_09305 [Clostridium sp.]|nr:hypothetical protein [Clostridium sp.]